jgi:hypothetical protein
LTDRAFKAEKLWEATEEWMYCDNGNTEKKEVYQKRHMYIISHDGDGMPTWLVRVRYLMELSVIFFKGQRMKIVYKKSGMVPQKCTINMKIS